ncbi:Dolichyldiphosphatase 1 [Mortierella sp. GBA30]|nr:Dolichyldiphosphatase 1 [Mortierella sp. GBA30]
MTSESGATLRQRKFIDKSMAAGSLVAAGLAASIPGAKAVGFSGSASKIPPHHTLTSVSLTHVQFPQGDLLSKLFAYVTLSPMALVCGYVAVIITSRDLKPAVMFAGQLANEIVNQILKRLVKQARPTEYLGDGYGMPSSHSQFMAYFATYTIVLMYRRGVTPVAIFPHAVSAIVIIWSALVVYSRVHLYYHTWQQVVAGTICGIIFALAYYFIANNFLRSKGFFEWIVEHPWAREMYIRDTYSAYDLTKFDWEMWQQHRKLEHEKSN